MTPRFIQVSGTWLKQLTIRMHTTGLVVSAGLMLTLLYNYAFFRNTFTTYTLTAGTLFFVLSLTVLLASSISLVLLFVGSRRILKPLLIVLFLTSSVTAYFMDSYNIIIDTSMIQNIVSTNFQESTDLASVTLLFYLFILGIVPSIIIYRSEIIANPFKTEFLMRLKVGIVLLVLIAGQFAVFGKYYASFIREHKSLRYYTNPLTYMYSVINYAGIMLNPKSGKITPVGLDAHVPDMDFKRELIILVIGETARADRFSLNGYARETNPLLSKENIINLSNVHSCGTTTAISVPCMFSLFGKASFSTNAANRTENLLDVLTHAGINILWRDNNSDSKGVATRVTYQDFKTPALNPVCDIECRDEGMLSGLDDYIHQQSKGDILIVLHQMGNHGPAYYKRYPAAFEKFKPVCKSINLNECSKEEINNAYDNAILYTDYFLDKVINFLKQQTTEFETSMVYMSDHGESLSENGLYLHGMPYFLAPEEQKHVAALLWFPENDTDVDIDKIKSYANHAFSHDNLYHTILGILEIKSDVYDPRKDISHLQE